jgi:hypothetical protein
MIPPSRQAKLGVGQTQINRLPDSPVVGVAQLDVLREDLCPLDTEGVAGNESGPYSKTSFA